MIRSDTMQCVLQVIHVPHICCIQLMQYDVYFCIGPHAMLSSLTLLLLLL